MHHDVFRIIRRVLEKHRTKAARQRGLEGRDGLFTTGLHLFFQIVSVDAQPRGQEIEDDFVSDSVVDAKASDVAALVRAFRALPRAARR